MDFNTDGTTDVSFIRMTAEGADFWAIEATGDYATDCKRGREAALELNRAMSIANVPTIVLGSVARSIMTKGRFSGLEVGFFQRLAEDLTAAPRVNG